MPEYANLIYGIYGILGIGILIGGFKSIDWLISLKYRTKDDCENCRKAIFEVVNKDGATLNRVDAKVDIILKLMENKDDTKL